MAGFLKKPIAPQINKAKGTEAQPIKPQVQPKPQPIKPIATPGKTIPTPIKPAKTILPGGGLLNKTPKPVTPQQVEEVKEDKKEEKVTLSPTPATETTKKEVKEKVTEEKLEVVEVKNLSVNGKELVDEKGEVKAEEVSKEKEEKEETPKGTKKKTAKRSTKKKEEAKEEDFIPEEIPSKSGEEYNEIIASTIIYSAGADWDKQVAELTEQLKGIVIEPDMNTATMKQAMADLVGLKDTVFLEYTLSKSILEAAHRKIDLVKGLNAKGSSADERKLNSYKACAEHKEGDLTINLFELLDVASVKYNFYDSLMKQIDFKAKSLITMNGALKLEKDALGGQI